MCCWKVRRLVLACVLACGAGAAVAMCADDPALLNGGKNSSAKYRQTPAPAVEPDEPPKVQALALIREAIRRNGDLGAAELSELASVDELKQSQASALPRATLGGSVYTVQQNTSDRDAVRRNQAAGSLAISGVLYDGGVNSRLIDYRSELSKAARYNTQAMQEQVIVETIAAALNRGRYQQQAQVYQQYARKMACLVDALTAIVGQDKGRASELIQARKTQQQAELSRDQAMAQSRQAEIRLRRLVGDGVRLGNGFVSLLAQVPSYDEMLLAVGKSGEVQRLAAQVEAGDRYAEAIQASARPQLNWVVAAERSQAGKVNSSSVSAGVQVSYNLFDWGSADASASAAARRAAAARRSYDEYVKVKVAKVGELIDVASSSFDRARRYIEVLKDSESVRNATFQQWSQLGRRSLFDVMSSEGDHFNLRVAYVNALYDGYEANTQIRSMGSGLGSWLGLPPVTAP